MFRNKIFASNGQAFEDLFISIMNYAEKGFKPIKPWGNIGDRKNDGYIKSTGTFYQVYAPEEIEKSYRNTVNKIRTDFKGLIEQWTPVKKFYFVINDKYKGVNADAEQIMQQIKKDYKLEDAEILIAKDLENILFEELEDDEIISIIGILPNLDYIKRIDYSILNEVIAHIMSLPLDISMDDKITVPDWEEKIKHNNLSEGVKKYLDNASIQLVSLDEYLSNNGNFLSNSLKEKLRDTYETFKSKEAGDSLFLSILNTLTPKQQYAYQCVVIVIMAKYFETCDIFEEPKKEDKNDYAK